MATGPFSGLGSVFVPQAEKALQVKYSLDESKFGVNKYSTIAKVSHTSGYYRVVQTGDDTRQVYADGRNYFWMDGSQPNKNFSKHYSWVQYTAQRFGIGFTVGDQTVQNAASIFDVLVEHTEGATMDLLLNRTVQVLAGLTDASIMTNTATATAAGGGLWGAGSSTNPYILKSLQAGLQSITKKTDGVVTPSDCALIISPAVATVIRSSNETIDFLKQSPFAMDLYSSSNYNSNWGLPPSLYGVKLIVEERVENLAKYGTTDPNQSFISTLNNSAVLIARPGTIQSAGVNGLSTATLAMFEDVSINMDHKPVYRYTEGVVSDTYATIFRPESGYLFTSVLS